MLHCLFIVCCSIIQIVSLSLPPFLFLSPLSPLPPQVHVNSHHHCTCQPPTPASKSFSLFSFPLHLQCQQPPPTCVSWFIFLFFFIIYLQFWQYHHCSSIHIGSPLTCVSKFFFFFFPHILRVDSQYHHHPPMSTATNILHCNIPHWPPHTTHLHMVPLHANTYTTRHTSAPTTCRYPVVYQWMPFFSFFLVLNLAALSATSSTRISICHSDRCCHR